MIWHEDRKPCAPCLIDEDEAARINRGLVVDPILPPLHDVRTVLLAGCVSAPKWDPGLNRTQPFDPKLYSVRQMGSRSAPIGAPSVQRFRRHINALALMWGGVPKACRFTPGFRRSPNDGFCSPCQRSHWLRVRRSTGLGRLDRRCGIYWQRGTIIL